jgi:hypothetical protein
VTVLACGACRAGLTVPLTRVALPVHAVQHRFHDLLGPLMEAGTYAVDPEPGGPPWRRWDDLDEAGRRARGWYATPPYAVPDGPAGRFVVAPGDTRGLAFTGAEPDGYCLGLTGSNGPNLSCAGCGNAVGFRVDDCGYWQAVWFDPRAVRATGPDDTPVADWPAMLATRPALDPIGADGDWHPRWSAAGGAALAGLLLASGGRRVHVPDGPLAGLFRRWLDGLLPPGPPARRATLAGPGLQPAPDIALVPRHPQTGAPWPCPGAAATVPLDVDVWMFLVSYRDRGPIPGIGALPEDAYLDLAGPLHLAWPFQPDDRVFCDALVRRPEVREPWLLAVYDRARRHKLRALGV